MANNENFLIRERRGFVLPDHGNEIAWNDPKIKYVTDRCQGKKVLDVGCVQHDARFATNKYWLHKAIVAVADSVVGLDLDSWGVKVLNESGYNVLHADAQNFALEQKFEVIVAGDLIEHLSNFGCFFESCVKHMNAGSTLIIATPNPWHWHSILSAAIGDVPVNGEHTCWLCPTTLSQLARRFGLEVKECEYGSRRLKDIILPLPRRLRHSTWFATLEFESAVKSMLPMD